jgi:hypothetical protein
MGFQYWAYLQSTFKAGPNPVLGLEVSSLPDPLSFPVLTYVSKKELVIETKLGN